MLNLKKYADGRFFDTVNKKFIKPEQLAEIIRKKETLKVTLTKTGKDITDAVVAEFAKKKGASGAKAKKEKKSSVKDLSFLNTESLKKWVGEAIDKQLGKVLDAVNLPSREQVEQLDKNIRELNRKIEALEKDGVKKAPAKKTAKASEKKAAPAPKKKAAPKKSVPAKEAPSAPPSGEAVVEPAATEKKTEDNQ